MARAKVKKSLPCTLNLGQDAFFLPSLSVPSNAPHTACMHIMCTFNCLFILLVVLNVLAYRQFLGYTTKGDSRALIKMSFMKR